MNGTLLVLLEDIPLGITEYSHTPSRLDIRCDELPAQDFQRLMAW